MCSVNDGALRAIDHDGQPRAECPLKRTDVKAEVSGQLARVTVTQQFRNPFREKIEALYVFPLPQSAAVDDMTMIVGARTVKGKIKRREEAQAIYESAREAGKTASLLDQERPNIFKQSVANIAPGAEFFAASPASFRDSLRSEKRRGLKAAEPIALIGRQNSRIAICQFDS